MPGAVPSMRVSGGAVDCRGPAEGIGPLLQSQWLTPTEITL